MYIWVGPRVGSGQTLCRQSRVGSKFRRVGSKKSDPWTILCQMNQQFKKPEFVFHKMEDISVSNIVILRFTSNFIKPGRIKLYLHIGLPAIYLSMRN